MNLDKSLSKCSFADKIDVIKTTINNQLKTNYETTRPVIENPTSGTLRVVFGEIISVRIKLKLKAEPSLGTSQDHRNADDFLK